MRPWRRLLPARLALPAPAQALGTHVVSTPVSIACVCSTQNEQKSSCMLCNVLGFFAFEVGVSAGCAWHISVILSWKHAVGGRWNTMAVRAIFSAVSEAWQCAEDKV